MKLKVGDKVTCSFIREESTIVRTIRLTRMESGVEMASADGGELCKACNTTLGRPIGLIVVSWYDKIGDES